MKLTARTLITWNLIARTHFFRHKQDMAAILESVFSIEFSEFFWVDSPTFPSAVLLRCQILLPKIPRVCYLLPIPKLLIHLYHSARFRIGLKCALLSHAHFRHANEHLFAIYRYFSSWFDKRSFFAYLNP